MIEMNDKRDPSHLNAMRGANEERTEPYKKYGEGVPQSATKQRAKSQAGAGSSAARQGLAVHGVPIVAIVGRANVGKSSLFNAILGRREAIVAREAGTTRDSVSAKVVYNDSNFWLVDTAGMKNPDDEFELSIQEQIAQAAESASLILVVVDAAVMVTEQDKRVAKLALKSQKPVLLVVNKIDTNRSAKLDDWQKMAIKRAVATSASQRQGIEELLAQISQHLPRVKATKDQPKIKLAILGRPNVGKSSLFNALANKQQALVSALAGTTRDINRLSVRYHNQEIEIADTAGIRRSGKIERGVEHFSVLRSLAAIEQSDIALLVMDAGELNVQLDQKIASMVAEAGKGLILIANKWDKAGELELDKDQVASQISREFAFVPWASLIFVSSVTGQNVTKIFELATEIAQSRSQRIKTTELNRWLQKILATHPIPSAKATSPSLNYMVQEDNDNLPSFKIFGSHIKSLHFSYRRYLERQFRQNWSFEGTPIKFWFINKKSP